MGTIQHRFSRQSDHACAAADQMEESGVGNKIDASFRGEGKIKQSGSGVSSIQRGNRIGQRYQPQGAFHMQILN